MIDKEIFSVKGKTNYEDYSSGRVLYNMPGTAPFPVKLGCEVFESCRTILVENGVKGPYILYDPFCGGGYLLTALGFLCGKYIKRIIASDIESKMVSLVSRNLSLLSTGGLKQRIAQIEQYIHDYGKESHRNALESAIRLNNLLKNHGRDVEVDCFCANAMKLEGFVGKLTEIDMVITDLPYGKITGWSGAEVEHHQVSMFLESLYDIISSHSVVAIVSDKKQKVKHPLYKKIDRFNAGKRQVTILGINTK